jgi:hypothetical protein
VLITPPLLIQGATNSDTLVRQSSPNSGPRLRYSAALRGPKVKGAFLLGLFLRFRLSLREVSACRCLDVAEQEGYTALKASGNLRTKTGSGHGAQCRSKVKRSLVLTIPPTT